jgi:hypothetical protein
LLWNSSLLGCWIKKNWIEKITTACQPVTTLACCDLQQTPLSGLTKCVNPDKETHSLQLNSRKIQNLVVCGHLKRSHARGTMFWTLASQLLLRGSSNRQFYSSRLIVNLVVYLYAKFGALNPRMNKIRSGGNWSQPVSQVQTCNSLFQLC